MSTVVLFHTALGLNDGTHAMAQVLRDEGHTVHTPDYYDGHVYTDSGSGIAYRDDVGFENLARRASAAVNDIAATTGDTALVFAGFSLGAAMAQSLGKRSPHAAGALLFHSGGAVQPYDWQPQVPLQVHHSVDDPWVDVRAASTLVTSAAQAGAPAAHFLYPGAGHLFADPTTAEYEPEIAGLMWQRVLDFLRVEAN